MSLKKGISIFFPFRSFHNQEFNLKVGLFLVLPLIFNIITLYALSAITDLWSTILNYVLLKLHVEGAVLYTKYTLFDFSFYLPFLDLVADIPSAEIWWATILVTLAFFILSFFISENFTPLKYFLRVFILIFWFTLLFFLLFPVGFPYNIQDYTKGGFLQIIALLFATPWIFGITYFLYGYNVIKKIIMTLIILFYLVVLAPFQYMLNSLIIHTLSLMFMPVLFLFAGLLINIFAIVAWYAYGISLEQTLAKNKN